MTQPRIIMADDDVDYSNSLKRALSIHHDLEMDFALGADQLIDKVRKGHYDLILTDNDMKDGHESSGLYAIGEIRKFDTTTPIFFNSSYLSASLSEAAKRAGATEVFGKDIALEKLKEKIARYVPVA